MNARRILANLDFEERLGGQNSGRAVLATISAFGTLLRVFAREGDRLWTPAPVAVERLAQVAGLPRPRLESGAEADLPPVARTLAWGAVQRARGERDWPELEGTPPGQLWRRLWRLPAADPAAAARANHREFALGVAERAGLALPGARMIDSVEQLRRHLAAGGAAAAPGGAWVVKAPYAAAGRRRVLASGDPWAEVGQESAAARVAALLRRSGRLLFEPWMERLEDVSCCAVATPAGARWVSVQGQAVDEAGRFRGMLPRPDAPGATASLARALHAAAAALAGAGYFGPFSLDAWRYRDAAGTVAFHPLGEINARLTFGWVSRALEGRLREAGTLPENAASLALRLAARGPIPEPAAGAAVIPLLLPGPAPAAACAWLELSAAKPRRGAPNVLQSPH